MTAPVLKIEDLTVEIVTPRGVVRPVDGVWIEAHPNEILCIVGESGSGKSMTMLAAIGLLPRTAHVLGQIRFRGQDLATLGEPAMRALRGRDIAMVFQDPMTALNPLMRIGAQLMEAIAIHAPHLRHAARRDRVLAAMNEVGIPNPEARLASYPHELSGGMRQRVMIAMALIHRPALVIADEPTTALDVTIQAQVLLLLRELRETTGAALVLITHDLGIVAENADRVIVLYGGRVMERARAADLLDNPRHPYSVGLLASVLDPDDITGYLYSIPGAPPAQGERIAGCVFRPRCAIGADRVLCAETVPPLRVIGADHDVACHYAEEVPGWGRAALLPAEIGGEGA